MEPLSADAVGHQNDAPSRAASVLQLVLETLPADDNDIGGGDRARLDQGGAAIAAAMVMDMLQTSIEKFDDIQTTIGSIGHSQVSDSDPVMGGA